MHIILFLLIMIIIISVIFIPIIHKSVTADIAAIEAMALNEETIHPDINVDVAPWSKIKTETLIAVYAVLAFCPSIFLTGLYPRFRQPVSVETIPVSYESGEEIPKNVTVIVDEENSTHFETITYKFGFLYEKETSLHVNLSDETFDQQ